MAQKNSSYWGYDACVALNRALLLFEQGPSYVSSRLVYVDRMVIATADMGPAVW